MSDFSVWKDFRRIDWRSTIILNVLRSIAAGVVWTVVGFAITQGQTAFFALMVVQFPMFYFVGLLPVGLFASWLSRVGVPFAGLVTLSCALFIVVADPLMFILHHIRPNLVPVDKYRFFDLHLLIYVVKPEMEWQ